MDIPLKAYAKFLLNAGIPVELHSGIQRDKDHDSQLLPPGERPRKHEDLGFPLIVEHDFPGGALGSDHATYSVAYQLARMIPRLKGKRVLDIGCGTGLLAIQAALAGADVVATDIDPEAVRLSGKNAAENGVTLDIRFGSLFEPIRSDERFDVIIANLPHKPCPEGIFELPLGQNGGPDGNELMTQALPGMLNAQNEGGELMFFLHSLPNPRFLRELGHHYELAIKSWKLRWLQGNEYGELQDHFRQRHADNKSFIWEQDGREALVACIWSATRKA